MESRMKAIGLCIVVAMAACASVNAARAPAAELSQAEIQQIEQAAAEWMKRHRAPALSVAIVLDGGLSWAKGFGFADPDNKIPATPTTVYRLASITKSITATAVMQLVEQGSLDLDAPIQKYCPAYPRKQWPITARLLLAHLAGVRHHSFFETLSPNTRHYDSVAAALNYFKDDDLLHEPGTEYHYTSLGYTVVGCAIEGASGTTYANYVREHIFVPAGMTRTEPDDVTKTIKDRAKLYGKGLIYKATGTFPRMTEAGALDPSDRLPAGGLVSTVEDLARFAIAIQQGKLVSNASRDLMWTRQKTRDGQTLKFYGFGWLIADADADHPKRVWNDGSQPGTRTFLYMRPDQRFAIALMTNLEGANCEELVPLIVDMALKNTRQTIPTKDDKH